VSIPLIASAGNFAAAVKQSGAPRALAVSSVSSGGARANSRRRNDPSPTLAWWSTSAGSSPSSDRSSSGTHRATSSRPTTVCSSVS